MPLGINSYPPDAEWFSNRPDLLADIRGDQAETIIPKIQQAVCDYPFAEYYRTWPGPNSNTFVAYVIRAVPDFNVDLPVTAIGKDYLAGGMVYTRLPGGRGLQLSLGGYVGFLVGLGEGIEINFLGVTFGIDFNPLALKLPVLGRVGLKKSSRRMIAPG